MAGASVVLIAFVACSSGSAGPALIVYEASDGSATNVYTIDPDSGETHQITFRDSFDGNPAWSPDRKRIVFSSDRDGTKNDLYVMDADGTNVRRLTETESSSELSPKFSRDGKTIAYVRDDADGWRVWTMRADGSDQISLTPTPYDFAEFPTWSPDGSELYFSAIEKSTDGIAGASFRDYYSGSGQKERAGTADTKAHIFSVDVRTRAVETRIRTSGSDTCPHFSRDGRRLTYASTSRGDQPTIYAHDVSSDDKSGASDAPITSGQARDDYANPSPDDRRMTFISDRDGNAELYVMERDGSGQRRVTSTPEVRENVPDW